MRYQQSPTECWSAECEVFWGVSITIAQHYRLNRKQQTATATTWKCVFMQWPIHSCLPISHIAFTTVTVSTTTPSPPSHPLLLAYPAIRRKFIVSRFQHHQLASFECCTTERMSVLAVASGNTHVHTHTHSAVQMRVCIFGWLVDWLTGWLALWYLAANHPLSRCKWILCWISWPQNAPLTRQLCKLLPARSARLPPAHFTRSKALFVQSHHIFVLWFSSLHEFYML